MRFSANGFYIEKYVKCPCCGMLVYGPGIAGTRHGKPCVNCSDWCVAWAGRRDAGQVEPRLPIVQPTMPIEKQHRPLGPRAAPPDLVTMNIIDSTMVSICREMGILLMKTSYSRCSRRASRFASSPAR